MQTKHWLYMNFLQQSFMLGECEMISRDSAIYEVVNLWLNDIQLVDYWWLCAGKIFWKYSTFLLQEKEIQAIADETLFEVRQKLTEARRCLSLLNNMRKLRNLRKEKASRKGLKQRDFHVVLRCCEIYLAVRVIWNRWNKRECFELRVFYCLLRSLIFICYKIYGL